MTAIESRAFWEARPAKGASYLAGTRGVKAHYTGGRVDPATLKDHKACHAAIRGIQNGHMDGNGWADIAYSMVVCNHAVMVGRGPHVLPAANGPGLNSGHYAILVLVGNAGVTQMTPYMRWHFHDARDFLRDHGGAGAEIKGHRDGYPTDCPGADVYAWVRAGAPRPGDPAKPPVTPPPPVPPKEDPHMEYGSFELTRPRDIPGGAWVSVPFDKENADPYAGHSGAGESILTTPEFPAEYSLEAGVELSGVPAGTWVSIRTAEFVYDNSVTPAVDKVVEAGWESTVPLPESGRVHLGAVGHVAKGRKLRVQVKVHPTGTGWAIARAGVKYLAQR